MIKHALRSVVLDYDILEPYRNNEKSLPNKGLKFFFKRRSNRVQ